VVCRANPVYGAPCVPRQAGAAGWIDSGDEDLGSIATRARQQTSPEVHFYGLPGKRLVGYDNERGRGDHRHVGDKQESYSFSTPERLIEDFLADVRPLRGER